MKLVDQNEQYDEDSRILALKGQKVRNLNAEDLAIWMDAYGWYEDSNLPEDNSQKDFVE